MAQANDIINRVLEEFARYNKIIFSSRFTKNKAKRLQYTKEFIQCYNVFVIKSNLIFGNLNNGEQENIIHTYLHIKEQIVKYLRILAITKLRLPNTGRETIDISHSDLEGLFDEEESSESSEEDIDPNEILNIDNSNILDNSGIENRPISPIEIENINTEVIMTHMGKVEFLGLCSRTINKTFDGEPLEARAFIDSVSLLREFATNIELEKVLLAFILAKVNASVREKIPNNPTTIDEIVKALTEKIRPDSSAIVEGRLLALNEKKLDEFQNKAEKLAEALNRALVLEGVSEKKAREMTVKSTVQLCRKKAMAPDVRAVLSATSFESPKEVLAKMITQINVVREERVTDYYKKNNRNMPFNKYGNNQNRNNSFRGGQRNYFNRNNQSQENNNNANRFNRYQGNGNRGNFRGNYRGQNGRGGFNNGNRNPNYNGNNYGNNNSNANQSIRAFTGQTQEEQPPQQIQLGFHSQN